MYRQCHNCHSNSQRGVLAHFTSVYPCPCSEVQSCQMPSSPGNFTRMNKDGSPGVLILAHMAHLCHSMPPNSASLSINNRCSLVPKSPARVLLRAWPGVLSHQCTPRLASRAVVWALSWSPSLPVLDQLIKGSDHLEFATRLCNSSLLPHLTSRLCLVTSGASTCVPKQRKSTKERSLRNEVDHLIPVLFF